MNRWSVFQCRFKEAPWEELTKIETFLGVDHDFPQERFAPNNETGCYLLKDADNRLGDSKGRPHPTMSEENLGKLAEFYRPYNGLLYEVLNKDFGWDG